MDEQNKRVPRERLILDQLHIDIARNSTDDFNPFHDPLRWRDIASNPFSGPIALGFQLEFLCSDRITRFRAAEGRDPRAKMAFRNFEFNFAGAARAGEPFEIDLRRTVDKSAQDAGLSNRAVIRKTDGTPLLLGTQSDTPAPRFMPAFDTDAITTPTQVPDRTLVPGSELFLKRKFLNTSNAKNFALGALCRQHDYIDELAENIHFAPLFTASLISCALLERSRAQGHDFEAEPMVYTSHQISVNMRAQDELRSNDALHVIVAPPEDIAPVAGLGKACVAQQLFHCAMLLDDGTVLLTARVQLASLQALAGLNQRPRG